jgi:hypothetical protein
MKVQRTPVGRAVNGQAAPKVAVKCSCFVHHAKKASAGQRSCVQYCGLSKGLVNQKGANTQKLGASNPDMTPTCADHNPLAARGGGSRSTRGVVIGAGLARKPTRWQIANTRSARFMV